MERVEVNDVSENFSKINNDLAKKIEDQFNTHMKKKDVPLLIDFSTYAKSLPVRYYRADNGIPEYIPLYKMGYYVRPDDLTAMTNAIYKRKLSRENVRYISAPTKSGKTASVLPAFLRSTSMEGGGTHYLYMAFDNNDMRHFTPYPYTPHPDEKIAEKQGAAFIVECVRTLLERPDDIASYTIKLEESPKLNVGACSKYLSEYLTEKLGENYFAFFHLDEHGKMCERMHPGSTGAFFSRGAMTALSCVQGVKVIASYTNRPSLLADKTSDVCRVPIALPVININQAMTIVPELAINDMNFNSEQKSLLASLKLRLAFKLREMDFISILYRRGSNKEAEEFLATFNDGKKDILSNTTEALLKCNQVCKYGIEMEDVNIMDPAAVELLLGIKDDDRPENRQIYDIVCLPRDRITYSISRMLEVFDPNYDVYDVGRDLFYEHLLVSPDLTSGSPLEAAYYWTLSCRSAMRKKLKFPLQNIYNINCKYLLPGRLFPETNNSKYSLDFLEKDTIYYADEKGRHKAKHPLADLFFVTKKNELVLIDIYGGKNKLSLEEKRSNLITWIKNEHSNILQYKLQGIVIAPNVNIDSSKSDEVLVVAGNDAIKLLGGLEQILEWLK